jgi:hypothetical protein
MVIHSSSFLTYYISFLNSGECWRGGKHGGTSINRNMILDALLFADDQVLIASSEEELQRAIYNLQKTVSDFDINIY